MFDFVIMYLTLIMNDIFSIRSSRPRNEYALIFFNMPVSFINNFIFEVIY